MHQEGESLSCEFFAQPDDFDERINSAFFSCPDNGYDRVDRSLLVEAVL